MEKKLLRFRKLALTSTIATYLLIFIGGLVRVSGSGLGCPDWPKCFGRWIPPLIKSQLPQGFDAASFNITLAWIEYLNRLAGMITGILIAVTAILAIKNFRDYKKLLIPSIAAALLVAFQGWYGSIVVKSELMPLTISIHMFLALVIVSLLIYVTVNAYLLNNAPSDSKMRSIRPLFFLLWIFTIIQIILGTDIRAQIEIIRETLPLLSSSEVLTYVGFVGISHSFLGIILMGGTILITFRMIKINILPSLYKSALGMINILVFIQILLGMGLYLLGITAILQVFHLWLASILIGIILFIYTRLSYQEAV